MIDCPHAAVAIEDLKIGDVVTTASSGKQKIRWIGHTKVAVSQTTAPIRIQVGALGENTPSKDLLVSPSHRMVISGWRAELLFGNADVLVPAKALVNDSTITVMRDTNTVEYFHIMFDKHEIVMSNGAASESFHPNQDAIGCLDRQTRAELLELFPELSNPDANPKPAVYPTLSDAEATLLH